MDHSTASDLLTSYAKRVPLNLTSGSSENLSSFKVFEEYEAILFAIVLIVFSIVGIFANGITFAAIWNSPKLSSTVFNVFLMSLCISDFLSAVDSIGVLYRRTWGFRLWAAPDVFCKLTLGVELWTTVNTMQHVVVFSLLRLLSLTIPIKFNLFTAFHAKLTVTFIWIETFFVGFVPFVIFPGVKLPPEDRMAPSWYSCTMQKKWLPSVKSFTNVAFPIFLYAPLILVVVLSSSVIFLILKRRKNSAFKSQAKTSASRKENFALVQLSLISFSFLLGYIPDFVFRLYSLRVRSRGGNLRGHSEWTLALLSHTILRFSECLNPFFYNLASSNMRQATFELLKKITRLEKSAKVGVSSTSGQMTVSAVAAKRNIRKRPRAGNDTPFSAKQLSEPQADLRE